MQTTRTVLVGSILALNIRETIIGRETIGTTTGRTTGTRIGIMETTRTILGNQSSKTTVS